jgi:hypothetical protein
MTDESRAPNLDLVATACRAAGGRNVFDVLDFRARRIDRWSVPRLTSERIVSRLEKSLPPGALPPEAESCRDYFQTQCMTPHTAQLAPNGVLLVGMGDPANGFCVLAIDTQRSEAKAMPADWGEGAALHCSTGGFRSGGDHWLFLRWPFAGSRDIAEGRSALTECEVWELDTTSLRTRLLCAVEAVDAGHQLTCSPDGRFAVFASFKWDIAAGGEGGRGSRLKPCELVAVDLQTGRARTTLVPVPAIAHPFFDPTEPDVFYLSAHNIRPVREGTCVEGPACMYRMRLCAGRPTVEGEYSDDAFFRITQHFVFCLDDRPIIAVTNLPNGLDLIDGRTMKLWRRRVLFEAPPLELGPEGCALCPSWPESCLSLCASADGRYVVLESAAGLRVYDVWEDRLADGPMSQQLPEGARIVGHMRTPCE